jgi:hypothetical protein
VGTAAVVQRVGWGGAVVTQSTGRGSGGSTQKEWSVRISDDGCPHLSITPFDHIMFLDVQSTKLL